MKNSIIILLSLLSVVLGLSAQEARLTKMSPMLADRLTAYVAAARGTAPTVDEYVLSLVKLTDSDETVLTRHGCRVIDHVGRIYVALLPVSQLAALSLDDSVERMEANPLSRTQLDITPSAVGAHLAHEGQQLPQAYTGRGVVVGICDVGFDFTQPVFMDANGQTRIRQAWDIYTGENSGYKGIGTLYTTPEALAAARGTCDSTQYHGTHVAAIAVGSATHDGRYQGIAPEADIVMSLTFLNGYTTDQYKNLINSLNAALSNGTADPLIRDVANKKLTLSNAMEALAIKHVMDYATEHQQPCVVNCSFGSQMTLTNDYSVQEEMLNSLTEPGRIIVCAAGNYGDGIVYQVKPAYERMDSRLWLKSSLSPTVTLRSVGDFTVKILPDIEGADTLRIASADIREAGTEGRKDSARIDGTKMQDWLRTTSRAYSIKADETAYAIQLTLPTPTSAYTTPSFAFVVEGDAPVEVMGAQRAATFNRLNTEGYVKNAPYTITVPAAYSQMVGVGLTSHRDSVTNLNGERITYEYNTGEPGQVVTWSGTGPTLEGRLKPDVVAPGHNIISAFNSNCNLENLSTKKKGQLVEHETIGDRDYYWKAESGTSMAAPVVTGTIALWLQANPQLTPDDVKQILAHTARHPEADETYPNYRYGYGEIDAYKGLLYITELTGIEGLSDHQPQHLTFRLTGRTLTLLPRTSYPSPFTLHPSPSTPHPSPFTITVYTIGGQPVLRAQPTDGTVDLSSLRPGIYAVQVDSGEAATTGSTLIRLQ